MGRDYDNIKTNETFYTNVSGVDFLQRIFLGLFPKVSAIPRSVNDCRLMVKIMRNYLGLQQYWLPYLRERYGLEKLSDDEKIWLENAIKFFGNIKNIEDLRVNGEKINEEI